MKKLPTEAQATQELSMGQPPQFHLSFPLTMSITASEVKASQSSRKDAMATMKALQQQVSRATRQLQPFPVQLSSTAKTAESEPDEALADEQLASKQPADAHLTDEPPPPDPLQNLMAQADRVNHLSAELEAALLDLKAIASAANPDWKRQQLAQQHATSGYPSREVCEYLAAVVPQVRQKPNGAYVVTVRSVDLFKAEREAASTAQALRHLKKQPKVRSPRPTQARRPQARPTQARKLTSSTSGSPRQRLEPTKQLEQLRQPLARDRQTGLQRKEPFYQRWVQQRLKLPTQLSAFLMDAVLWATGAIVLRIGIDFLLASFPIFWPPIALMLIMPAMIVAGLTTLSPQAGFAVGYRLLLILVGLLLGGQL